ncbi:MAG: HAMP domain-containing sensor histidine kinase [Rhodoglobus sp.]
MILNRLSIRARITIGSFLLAIIFFTGTAIIVDAQVVGILDRSTLELLESDSAPYVRAGADLGAGIPEVGQDQRLALIDAEGTIRLSTLPARLTSFVSTLRVGADGPRTITISGHSYRGLVTRVETGEGPWTILAVRSEATNQLILDRLTVDLAWGLAGLSLLFALVSWLLTGAALAPVGQLRRSADSLVTSGSADLLAVGQARDEVSQLATTLNNLISSLHDSAAREKQLVSDASHELRTPLAILQARLELLQRAVPAENRDEVRAADAAVQRLATLVADLLELSRIEAAPGGSATVADLGMALTDSVDRGRFAAASTHITIDYEIAPARSDGVVAMGIETFGRLVDNLVKNAVAALDGSGAIAIDLACDADAVTLTVTDDGPGIGDEFLSRAFDRFSREDSARSSHQGTGLGLSIVKAAVEAAHGAVELDSASTGLRVSVRLPLATIRDSATRVAANPTE